MSVFGEYSRYYDLLYKDKDYTQEADYIDQLIRKNRPEAKTILDLGCGTGRHAIQLANKGYNVLGVDISNEMLEVARQSIPDDMAQDKITFDLGDIRNYNTDKKFDVCVSLFHVMSYQTHNEDLISAFNTAAKHLNRDGIFIFDCWFGPAVLTDRPCVRVKRLSDGKTEVVRIAEPVMHPNENGVDVNYSIFIRDKVSQVTNTISETHKMRYLFKPEIIQFLKETEMTLLDSFEFFTNKELDFTTWYSCFVGKKI